MSAGKGTENELPVESSMWSSLSDLHRLLRFQQSLGINEYPLNEDIRRFLNRSSSSGWPARRTVSAASGQVPAPEAAFSAPVPLAALEQEIAQCALCPLGGKRLGTVIGRGQVSSRLMVVGDWSGQDQECNPEILFGAEEDTMLWKMMAAIGLGQDEVFVTNILKCCPGVIEACPECWQSCFSFLEREIAAVRPQVICAMGELATGLLVGSQEPLLRLRGKFNRYRYQPAGSIPVMPTFHPRYLLKNPEMKKAAWKDLQEIKQRLDQIARSSGA